jgi:hypothetical protein
MLIFKKYINARYAKNVSIMLENMYVKNILSVNFVRCILSMKNLTRSITNKNIHFVVLIVARFSISGRN